MQNYGIHKLMDFYLTMNKLVTHAELINLFNEQFKVSEHTILVETENDPLYLPIDASCEFNRIFCTKNSFASIFHEIAHWCIAGLARRKLVDYGYWCKLEDRSPEEQQLHRNYEKKTQAIEWIFSVAANTKFLIIPDNAPHSFEASEEYKQGIYTMTMHYLDQGLPPRAEIFKNSLLAFYEHQNIFSKDLFIIP